MSDGMIVQELILCALFPITPGGIIATPIQVGITIQVGIISLGMVVGEDAFSNNGIRMVVSKLGIADSFLSIKPVAIAAGIFFCS
jgi:hypothetical protein